jgi:hypothetical protein
MGVKHQIAARAGRLMKRHPALRPVAKRTAVQHLARMLAQADFLTAQLLGGKLTGQPALRAVADLNRAIIDLMARLGLVPGLPKAGEETEDGDQEDDLEYVRRILSQEPQ